MSFAFNAITLVQVDSFLTGSVVLGGLFVYDIWWVFGTEVVSGPPLCVHNGPLTLAYGLVYKDGQSGNKT